VVVRADECSRYGGFGYGALLEAAFEIAQEKASGLSILNGLPICGLRSATCDLAARKIDNRQPTNDNQFQGCQRMSKRELIDYICRINKTAKAEFLAAFSEEELNDYLEHLMALDLEELVVCG
jgi:hypothetical protein